MASKRPGFARVDTDLQGVPLSTLNKDGQSSKTQDWKDDEPNKAASADVTEVGEVGDLASGFREEDEDHFGVGDVITTVSFTCVTTSILLRLTLLG